jgi:hypothetical protein
MPAGLVCRPLLPVRAGGDVGQLKDSAQCSRFFIPESQDSGRRADPGQVMKWATSRKSVPAVPAAEAAVRGPVPLRASIAGKPGRPL